MNQEVRELAFNKMLNELEKNKNAYIDNIHNWLCDQEDDELMFNITKENKTIIGAFSYVKLKAQKEAVDGTAMIEDKKVYDWVVEYYTLDKIEELEYKPARAIERKPELKPEKPIETLNRVKKEVQLEGQLSMFDL